MSVNEAIEKQLALLDFVSSLEKKNELGDFDGSLVQSLKYGATYFWSTDFCKLLEGQVNMLPNDAVLNITDFLSESGFIWFEKPLKMPIDPTVESRFIEWEQANSGEEGIIEKSEELNNNLKKICIKIDNLYDATGKFQRDVLRSQSFYKPNIKVTTTDDGKVHNFQNISLNQLRKMSDDVKDPLYQIGQEIDNWTKQIEQWQRDFVEQPIQAIGWALGSHEHVGSHAFLSFWTIDEKSAIVGLRPGIFEVWYINSNLEQTLEYIKMAESYPNITIAEQAIKYACASILFMVQKVFTHSDERPNRAVRHRIAAWRPDPIVKVIRLRRQSQPSNSNPDHDSPDHAFQWMVTGHWRNQWYPTLNRHQTIWIAPFIKGPPDKPLKEPRSRIYAVVR